MIKYHLIISVLISCGFSLQGQDYTGYYNGIDSAHWYFSQKQYGKADSLYLKTFSKFNGFPGDYERAFYASLEHIKKIRPEYIRGYARNHGGKVDLRSTLKSIEEKYGYAEYKVGRLYRTTKKHKLHRKNNRIIRRMIWRDQWYRRKNRNISEGDSINAAKLWKRYQKDSTLFTTRHLKNIPNQILTLLLFHQGYANWGDHMDLLHNEIKKGHIHRYFFWYLMERETVWGGNTFELNNDTLTYHKGENSIACTHLYYSLSGEFPAYYDRKEQKEYYVPLNPAYTRDQINALRQYCFYPSLELYMATHTYRVLLEPEAFCEKFPGK